MKKEHKVVCGYNAYGFDTVGVDELKHETNRLFGKTWIDVYDSGIVTEGCLALLSPEMGFEEFGSSGEDCFMGSHFNDGVVGAGILFHVHVIIWFFFLDMVNLLGCV